MPLIGEVNVTSWPPGPRVHHPTKARRSKGATVTLRDGDGEPFSFWLRYPGRRRPGQWSEGTRWKRARRLERARERHRPRLGRGKGLANNRAGRRAEQRRFAMIWADEAKITPLPGEPTKALLARAQAIEPLGPLPF